MLRSLLSSSSSGQIYNNTKIKMNRINPTNAHIQNVSYHILLITNILRWLLSSSSSSSGQIYNNTKRTINCQILYLIIGKYETSITKLSVSTCTFWQFSVFIVLLYSCPNDDSKIDKIMLLINNMCDISYRCICWFCYTSVSCFYSKQSKSSEMLHHGDC